jgi:23S rRNA pseudouridine1911/1915/1917 synthase
MESFELLATVTDKDMRLDQYLTEQLQLTRSQIKNMLDLGWVLVNQEQKKAGYKLKPGDRVCGTPLARPPDATAPQAEAIPLDVLFQDEDIIVINKPPDLAVHPAPGHYTGTLVHALLHHFPDIAEQQDASRPGIVHRLDMDTSGVMVIARNIRAHNFLAAKFKDHDLTRCYQALVYGRLRQRQGEIATLITRHPVDRKKMAVSLDKGRPALTYYTVLEEFREISLVKLQLQTGRTHQIRVHMTHLGHPVVGDPHYGNSHHFNRLSARLQKQIAALDRQALHAYYLKIEHPTSGRELEFTTALPADMQQILDILRQEGV